MRNNLQRVDSEIVDFNQNDSSIINMPQPVERDLPIRQAQRLNEDSEEEAKEEEQKNNEADINSSVRRGSSKAVNEEQPE